LYYCTSKGIKMKENSKLISFVKQKRKLAGITQVELSEKADVGLRFVRDLEQGKKTLRMDTVNKVLAMFGAELAPVAKEQENE
jgi:y4mF family transcriptional regulator